MCHEFSRGLIIWHFGDSWQCTNNSALQYTGNTLATPDIKVEEALATPGPEAEAKKSKGERLAAALRKMRGFSTRFSRGSRDEPKHNPSQKSLNQHLKNNNSRKLGDHHA